MNTVEPLNAPKQEKPEPPIVRGDLFRVGKNTVMLCRTQDDTMALICLNSGNRWGESVTVPDAYRLTIEEFSGVCGMEKPSDFTRITEPIVIRPGKP